MGEERLAERELQHEAAIQHLMNDYQQQFMEHQQLFEFDENGSEFDDENEFEDREQSRHIHFVAETPRNRNRRMTLQNNGDEEGLTFETELGRKDTNRSERSDAPGTFVTSLPSLENTFSNMSRATGTGNGMGMGQSERDLFGRSDKFLMHEMANVRREVRAE